MKQAEKQKAEIMAKLRGAQAVYVPMAGATRMPYVVCDEETFDDEILLYFTEEDAKRETAKLKEAGRPMQIIKVENRDFLMFYTGLYPMGVNCVLVEKDLPGETAVQLDDLIRRPKEDQLPDGRIRVENPELHLTALYFLQEMRRVKKEETKEQKDALQELNDEMMAHFRKSRFIVAVEEGKGVPILKQKEGSAYQPVFTDIQEFKKFQSLNKEAVLKTVIIEAEKLPANLAPEVAGVAVNPFGMNLQLQMKR